MLANIPTMFDCCEVTVIVVMYSTSRLLLKLIVAHLKISLTLKLETWRGVWQLAKHALGKVFPKNVYQLRETLFHKLDSVAIPRTENLFNNIAIFGFESICVEDDNFNATETAKWIGQHFPISVSISSILIQEPIFCCDPNPSDLVSSFIDALENLATQSKTQMKMNFQQTSTTIKNRLARILEVLNQCRSHCVGIEAEDDNSSTQFYKSRKTNSLTRTKNLRDFPKDYQSLGSTVQGTMSTLSGVTYLKLSKRTRNSTDCYRKSQSNFLVQIW